MRGRNERNEVAGPRRVWGRDVDADERSLLDRDRIDASELGDQIAKVRLVSDEQKCVVTTPGEEFGDMGCSRTVGKMLINCGSCLKRRSDHRAGFGATSRG
jgi:hypothetical protein